MIKSEPYPYDTPFVAECRQMQSRYREELGLPLRPYTVQNRRSKDFGKVYNLGNYISSGKEDGANFLADYIFVHAKDRLNNREPYETFDEDRMFNNLLSSQPMAFNLFCPLRKLLEENRFAVTKAIQAALPHYSIAIETKYSENLGSNAASFIKLSGEKYEENGKSILRPSKNLTCFFPT